MNTLGYNLPPSGGNSPNKLKNTNEFSQSGQNNANNLYKQYLESNSIGDTIQPTSAGASYQNQQPKQFSTIQANSGANSALAMAAAANEDKKN
jgi:hypothetical protein